MIKNHWTILRLSFTDLRHEWILTLCLMIAVSSVLFPLLTLFGLKNGTIHTLQQRLVKDPRNLEVRPMISKSFTRKWFESVKQNPRVAFLVPMTRTISASVDVGIVKSVTGEDFPMISLDVIPTAEGDPLLTQNGCSVPNINECVLTQSSATELNASVGDQLMLRVKRLINSRYEMADMHLNIKCILDPRAGSLKQIYTTLSVLEAIEQYKDGMSVPEYGWTGTVPNAIPRYDGLILAIKEPLKKIDELTLINGTGFTKIRNLTGADRLNLTGFYINGKASVYLLSTLKSPITSTNIMEIKNRLRGKNVCLIPWIREIQVELISTKDDNKTSIEVRALSNEANPSAFFDISPKPIWDDSYTASSQWRCVVIPETSLIQEGCYNLQYTDTDGDYLVFPVDVIHSKLPGKHALIPARLAGILKLFQERNVIFNQKLDTFLMERRGYASFRLYASSMKNIPILEANFRKNDIPVHTQADRIRDVLELDQNLSRIFWVIAVVGVICSITILTSSMYASIERKKKEMSILRLMGISRAMLFQFPLYQSIMIGMGGLACSFIAFEIFNGIINELFRNYLLNEECLCKLTLKHKVVATFSTLLISISTSFLASWQTTRIDPAEAIRDE